MHAQNAPILHNIKKYYSISLHARNEFWIHNFFFLGHMNVNSTYPRDLVSCKNLYIQSYTRLLLLFANNYIANYQDPLMCFFSMLYSILFLPKSHDFVL